ncbi:MAG: hypothetical protein U9R36_03865, partial [Elusimicrobiota bacterium]|nr:hypothetical protein [Elusimicrobiota bacterium]
YYVIGGTIIFLLLFTFTTIYFVKQLVSSNSATMKELSELSSEKTKKLDSEIKKLRRRSQKNKEEEEKSRQKESRNVRIERERIKKEYEELLKESLNSTSRAPKSPSEPVITEEPAADKDKEIEVKAEFRRLKKVNYENSVKLLRKFIKNKNIWMQLWGVQLAAEIKPVDAVNILKDTVSSDEYQVSKRAIKTLRGFLDSKKTDDYLKKEIEGLIDSVRREGWVV